MNGEIRISSGAGHSLSTAVNWVFSDEVDLRTTR